MRALDALRAASVAVDPRDWWPLICVFQRHFFPCMNSPASSPQPQAHISGDPVTGPDCICAHKSLSREDRVFPGEEEWLIARDLQALEVVRPPRPHGPHRESEVADNHLIPHPNVLHRDAAARGLHQYTSRQTELAVLIAGQGRHEVDRCRVLVPALPQGLQGERVMDDLLDRVGLPAGHGDQ